MVAKTTQMVGEDSELTPAQIKKAEYYQSPEGLAKLDAKNKKDANIQALTQQILGQKTTDKWTGQGWGSAEKNAEAMAKMLDASGITDIKQFGKVDKYEPVQEIGKTYNGKQVYSTGPDEYGNGGGDYYYREATDTYDSDGNQQVISVRVPKDAKLDTLYGVLGVFGGSYGPIDSSKVVMRDGVPTAITGQTWGNKTTGQTIESGSGRWQWQGGDNLFGGTGEGKGNTAFRVNIQPDGTPVFYTTQGSSNDLAKLMSDLGPVGQIGLAIATGGLSIPQQIAARFALNVLSGQDVGDAVKGAAVSYAMAQIPGTDVMKESSSFLKDIDPTGTLTSTFQNSVMSGAGAFLTGGDVGSAMLEGAASGGINGAMNALLNTSDFKDLTKDLTDSQKKIIVNAASSAMSGKPLDQIVINSAIAAAKDAAREAGVKDADLKSFAVAPTESALRTKDITSSITGDTKIDQVEPGNLNDLIKQVDMFDTTQDEFGNLDAEIERQKGIIAKAPTFNEAFAAARLAYKPGDTFTWNGKDYKVTSLAEDALATAKPTATDQSDAETNRLLAQNKTLSDASVANQSSAETARLARQNNELVLGNAPNESAAETQRLMEAGERSVAQNLSTMGMQALGTTVRGAASFINNAGNTYAQLTGDYNYDNTATRLAKEIEEYAKGKDVYGLDVQKNRMTQALAQADNTDNFWDKVSIIKDGIKNNPLGFFDIAGTEAVEEIPGTAIQIATALMTGGGSVVALNSARIIQGTVSLVDSFMESFGAGGKEAYQKAIARGDSEQTARDKSFINASIAAITEMVPDFIADKALVAPMMKNFAEKTLKNIGADYATSSAAGVVSNFVSGAAQNYATAYTVDPNTASWSKALTAGIFESTIGGTVQTAFSTPGSVVDASKVIGKDYAGNDVTLQQVINGGSNIDPSTVDKTTSLGQAADGTDLTVGSALTFGEGGFDADLINDFMPDNLKTTTTEVGKTEPTLNDLVTEVTGDTETVTPSNTVVSVDANAGTAIVQNEAGDINIVNITGDVAVGDNVTVDTSTNTASVVDPNAVTTQTAGTDTTSKTDTTLDVDALLNQTTGTDTATETTGTDTTADTAADTAADTTSTDTTTADTTTDTTAADATTTDTTITDTTADTAADTTTTDTVTTDTTTDTTADTTTQTVVSVDTTTQTALIVDDTGKVDIINNPNNVIQVGDTVNQSVVTPTVVQEPPAVVTPVKTPPVVPPVVTPPVSPPVVQPPVQQPKVSVSPKKTTQEQEKPSGGGGGSSEGPITPPLANVFYYGKDFGTQRQEVGPGGKLYQAPYRELSVSKPGAEMPVAQQARTEENDVNAMLQKILSQQDDSVTMEELMRLLG